MGLLSTLTGIVNGPYRYRAGPSTLGIGSENLALVLPGVPVQSDFNSPRYNVRGNFETHFSTIPQTGVPSLPYYDLRQNGAYLTGAVQLGGLVDMGGQTG